MSKRFTFLLLLSCLLNAAAAFGAKNDTITVIDEDFSAFTDGTEDAPSTTEMLNDFGYFRDSTLFKPYDSHCTRAWGGAKLFAAGGALAVTSGGFLNTPAGDMSGDLKITFRARVVKGQSTDKASVDVILLSRKVLVDYRRWTINLTTDWQTFTLEANNGWFKETGIQFFSMSNVDYLVDDIKVTRVQTSIIPPDVHEPEAMNDTGFTAVWDSTETADDYLLSVYSKQDNPDVINVTETFDEIKTDDNGKLAEQPETPEGWGFKWNNDTTRQIAADGHSGSQSVRLSQEFDYVETPLYVNNFSTFKLWVKAEADTTLTGTALVYVREENGWIPWQYIGMEALRKLKEWTEIDFSSSLNAFEHVYGVRVEYQPGDSDKGALLIDDISYTVPGNPIITYALQDKPVEGRATTSYVVTGLNPDVDYYYSVKARNSEFTSDASEEMEAFYVSQPEAQPATDVTDTGYTANWTCGKKADYFRLDQLQETHLTEDVDSFTVLYEDFSRVKASDEYASFDWPDQGPQTSVYTSIDSLTLVGGWKASSWQLIDGWLGGAQKMDDNAIAGAIVTPTIDLSHDGGTCSVSVRAYGYGGDWLIIQGVSPAARAFIEFPADGGIVDTTVSVPLCGERENLTFYSNNYYPFLIDFIKITQKMKAGETASVITKSVVTPDATAHSAVIDNAGFSDSTDTRYKVTAFRYYHGNKNDVWASVPSELVTVSTTSGINALKHGAATLSSAKGGLAITGTTAAMAVQVYDLNGAMVKSATCGKGQAFIPLKRGIYIVKIAGRGEKVVVR